MGGFPVVRNITSVVVKRQVQPLRRARDKSGRAVRHVVALDTGYKKAGERRQQLISDVDIAGGSARNIAGAVTKVAGARVSQVERGHDAAKAIRSHASLLRLEPE